MTSQPPPLTATADVVPRLRESDRAIRTLQVAMHVLFVVLLVVGTVRALVTGAPGVWTVGGVVVFAGIYLSGLLLERRSLSSSKPSSAMRAGTVWIVAVIAAWAGLLCLAGDFAWLAFALYFLVLHVARRPVSFALVGLVLALSIAALLGHGDVHGDARPGLVVGPTIGMLVALGISWVYSQLRAENEARKRLVEELIASHDDLLATQEALAQTQHEAGVLAERTRLARDIHDTLAQSFSSIVLLSRAGLARTPGDDTLRQIEAQAQSGLHDARGVVGALTPSELDGSPLTGALTRLTDRLTTQTGITAVTHTEGTPFALPTALDVAVLRIAQSALANVRQHSQASRCAVTLSYEADGPRPSVRLEVIDDGIGFTEADVASAPMRGSGFGLAGMKSRVAELGGTIDIESAPAEGCAILVCLPAVNLPVHAQELS